MTEPMDTERALESLVGAGRRLLDVTVARLWVLDPVSGEAVCVVSDVSPDDPVDLDGAPLRSAAGEGVVGYPQLSSEYVVAADPDMIFLADSAYGESVETVAARPGWGAMSAVRNGAVFELDRKPCCSCWFWRSL